MAVRQPTVPDARILLLVLLISPFPVFAERLNTEDELNQTGSEVEEYLNEVADEPLSPGVVRLRGDEAFMRTSWHGGGAPARTAAENCNDWEGKGFKCGIEFPEHKLVRDWIPPTAVVMEFGARFGSTSCEIAKRLANSGRVVSIEPDTTVWQTLEKNLNTHNCNVHVVHGVLSSQPVRFQASNYASRTNNETTGDAGVVVPNFEFEDIENALGMTVDTLLIDCEGCAQHMMDQIGPKIKTQINLVLIESDMGDDGGDCKSDCMNYTKFFDFLEESGFEMVEKKADCDSAWHGAPEGTWCGPWIWHYAYKRRSP